MKFKKPIEVQAGISDGDPTNPLGISGYLLSSDGSNVNWISPGGLSAETAEAIVQPIKANGALSKGDPVYIVGYQAGQNANIVAKADSSDVAKMPVVGLADDDYADGNFGTMTAFGSFNGAFDTTGGTENWAVGDIIFVKPGGGLTNIKPTGTDLIQNVAIVSRVQQNTGELEVIALGRTNDVPNLPTGRLFVGTAANTSLASDVIYVDDANGRMGVGSVTSPATVLHVGAASNSGSTTEEFRIQTGTGSGLGGLAIVNLVTGSLGGSGIYFGDSSTYSSQPAKVSYLDAQNALTYNTAQFHYWQVGGSTRMTLNGNNVGINTTNPQTGLHLSSGVDNRTVGGTDVGIIRLTNTYSGNFGAGGEIQFGLQDVSGRDVLSLIKGSYTGWNSGNYGGDLEFHTRKPDGLGLQQRMTITDAGDVGIGTTNPSSKLEVNTGADGVISRFRGSTNAGVTISGGTYEGVALSAKIHHESSNRNLVLETNGTGKLYFNTNGANARMVINNSGKVGIGTPDPQAQLTLLTAMSSSPTTQIYLDVDGSNANGGGGEIIFNTSASEGSPTTYNAKITGTRSSTGDGSSDLSFFTTLVTDSTSPSLRMTIKDNGDVGIGTPSPDTKLEVSSLSGGVLRLTSTDTSVAIGESIGRVEFKSNDASTGGNNVMGFIDCLATNAGTTYALSLGTGLAASATEKMRIDENGKVSIGTDTTSAKLEVRQDANNGNTGAFTNTHVKLTASATADNTGFVGITAATSTSNLYGYSFGAQRTSGGQGDFKINYHVDNAAGVNRFIIDQVGKVGIGTTSPAEKLAVDGSIRIPRAEEFYWTDGSINGSARAVIFSTTNEFGGDYNGIGFSIAANGRTSPSMYIRGTGKVGIGTTAPQSALQVNGGVQLANDTASPSASKVGTFRYRTSGNNSYVDMCMQTGASTYAWVNIVANTW